MKISKLKLIYSRNTNSQLTPVKCVKVFMFFMMASLSFNNLFSELFIINFVLRDFFGFLVFYKSIINLTRIGLSYLKDNKLLKSKFNENINE